MGDAWDQACINLRWALALLDGLIQGGMRRLVISPGSRSTPVVLAAQRQPELELSVILDERSAGFFALGAAQSSGRPVGLLCTSGSAPAHWLPAVIEASESEVPLILLSADRPPELRGWGANQTIDQSRLFDGFLREFHDPGPAEANHAALKMIRTLGLRAAAVSRGSRPGPVHLNLPFREPLTPDQDDLAHIDRDRLHDLSPIPQAPFDGQGWKSWAPPVSAGLGSVLSGRGLICCGPGAGAPAFVEALWNCAERLGLPVLCDPLSGLRFGPAGKARISGYDSFLRAPSIAAALKPDWVLRLGRAPVSKTLAAWLADIPTVLVDPGGRWSDPTHDVRLRLTAHPAAVLHELRQTARSDQDWLARWTAAEQQIDALTSTHLAQGPWCEPHLIQDLLERLPEDDALLCANSMPIRQLDSWSGALQKRLRVFGNRGASGIDGQASTLAGLNAGGVPTTGLLGDLSFLHDLSGLLLLRGLKRPCIVINNGGGRIFDYLPQHGLPDFERFWRTPVGLDIAALSATFGLRHFRVEDAAGFAQAMELAMATDQGPGPVIEVQVNAEQSRAVHQDFWQSLRELSTEIR